MDLEALKARWSKARQFDIQFRGATFHYRLPDSIGVRNVARDLREASEDQWVLELFKRSLIGWDGVTEDTLVEGGTESDAAATVPFDIDLAVAWVREITSVWRALVDPVVDHVREKREAAEEAAKN